MRAYRKTKQELNIWLLLVVQQTFNSCYLPSWVFLSPGPFFSLLEFPNHSVDGYGHCWPFYCKMYFTLQFWSLLPLMATLVWFFQNSVDSTSDGHTTKILLHLSWAIKASSSTLDQMGQHFCGTCRPTKQACILYQ